MTKARKKMAMLDELRAKVADFGRLPAGWYGARSKPVSAYSMRMASSFIDRLEAMGGMPVPHVSPSPAGRIGFDWSGTDTDGRELYVTFGPVDGQITVLRVDESAGIEDEFGAPSLDDLVPSLAWLTKRASL